MPLQILPGLTLPEQSKIATVNQIEISALQSEIVGRIFFRVRPVPGQRVPGLGRLCDVGNPGLAVDCH